MIFKWKYNFCFILLPHKFSSSIVLVKSPECSLIILLVGLSSVRLFEEYILWCRSLPNSESFLVDQLWMLLEIGRVWCGLRPWFLSVIFVFWMATMWKGISSTRWMQQQVSQMCASLVCVVLVQGLVVYSGYTFRLLMMGLSNVGYMKALFGWENKKKK